jgi:hypothetical protein
LPEKGFRSQDHQKQDQAGVVWLNQLLEGLDGPRVELTPGLGEFPFVDLKTKLVLSDLEVLSVFFQLVVYPPDKDLALRHSAQVMKALLSI